MPSKIEVITLSIDQFHVASSPLAALFKVLLEDQKRIVCIEFNGGFCYQFISSFFFVISLFSFRKENILSMVFTAPWLGALQIGIVWKTSPQAFL